MQKFTIRPVVLKHKANAEGMVTIRIALTINRKQMYFATEFRIHKEQWNEKKRSVINHENETLINVSLRRQIAEIEKRAITRTLEEVPITKSVINSSHTEDKSFYKFAKEVREDRKELNRLKLFAGDTLLLSEINVSFLRKYEMHERKRGMSQNTLNTTFRYIGRIINQAQKEKLIKENPFVDYSKPKYRQTDRTYLTEIEIHKILNSVDNFTGYTKITAYWLLLACYTGLRHSDWCRFDYAKMIENDYVKLRAKKNKTHVVLPIGITLAKILEVIKTLPSPLSHQKSNEKLKNVADLTKINKTITTHVGRHSFGYLCASNRIPKSVTAELMGISVRTVEVYYHLSGQNIIEQASVLKTL